MINKRCPLWKMTLVRASWGSECRVAQFRVIACNSLSDFVVQIYSKSFSEYSRRSVMLPSYMIINFGVCLLPPELELSTAAALLSKQKQQLHLHQRANKQLPLPAAAKAVLYLVTTFQVWDLQYEIERSSLALLWTISCKVWTTTCCVLFRCSRLSRFGRDSAYNAEEKPAPEKLHKDVHF